METNQQKIEAFLSNHDLVHGLGTKQSPCSVAAINLAITGKLTDDIPSCMSQVIGRWIIRLQDSMPIELLNSKEWKSLLPLAVGTGRNHEKERLEIIMNWMWKVVLPTVQPVADENGFGKDWSTMCNDRTSNAADAADAADANARVADAAADAAARADAADDAADAARAAADAARAAADAADDAAYAAAYAADAADDAARAAAVTARAAAVTARAAAVTADYWQTINPCKLLQELIEVSN